MRNKGFDARLRPFVEPLEQGQSQGVLQQKVFGLVVARIACVAVGSHLVIVLGIVVGRCVVCLIDVFIVAHFHGVDETGHGHELLFHQLSQRIGFGCLCQQRVGLSL